jgi:hypothetical protein
VNMNTVFNPLHTPAVSMVELLNAYEVRRKLLWDVHVKRYEGVPLRWDSRTDQTLNYADLKKLDKWLEREVCVMYNPESIRKFVRVQSSK